jgi:hypothetical protein
LFAIRVYLHGIDGTPRGEAWGAISIVSAFQTKNSENPQTLQCRYHNDVSPYEQTPGSCTPLSGTYTTNCVTGRIASVTLPTGGEVSYTYTGGSNGIESDGSPSGLTRTLKPGGGLYNAGPTFMGSGLSIRAFEGNNFSLHGVVQASNTSTTGSETDWDVYGGPVTQINAGHSFSQAWNTPQVQATVPLSAGCLETTENEGLPISDSDIGDILDASLVDPFTEKVRYRQTSVDGTRSREEPPNRPRATASEHSLR